MIEIRIDETTGQHTALLSQRELATLRVVAQRLINRDDTVSGYALNVIAGDCGNNNCEACSLDGDAAYDARYALYGE